MRSVVSGVAAPEPLPREDTVRLPGAMVIFAPQLVTVRYLGCYPADPLEFSRLGVTGPAGHGRCSACPVQPCTMT